jgi:hypothetical protein
MAVPDSQCGHDLVVPFALPWHLEEQIDARLERFRNKHFRFTGEVIEVWEER